MRLRWNHRGSLPLCTAKYIFWCSGVHQSEENAVIVAGPSNGGVLGLQCTRTESVHAFAIPIYREMNPMNRAVLNAFAFSIALCSLALCSSAIAQDNGAAKKEVTGKKKSLMHWIQLKITDLSDEQLAAMTKLEKATAVKNKAMMEEAGITWKMSKKRNETLEASAEKSQDLYKKAFEMAGYNADQIVVSKKIAKNYLMFRVAAMKHLKAEQLAMLPKNYQKEFELAKKRAAAEKK